MKNAKLRFPHFIRSSFLRRLGRPLLATFFARFDASLKAVVLARSDLPDEAYFSALAAALAAPEALPPELAEALYAIDELSNAESQEQLEQALAQNSSSLVLDPEGTRSDLAMRVWLSHPGLLARIHNQHRLRRLTAFECFGPATVTRERALPPPDGHLLDGLAAALDPWFARHHRGHNTTRLELYPIDGDYWFLVRHGDTFTRTPKVDAQKTEVIHFRPERDDVVVYVPEHDELRINARTRGERRLYVEIFGLRLHGSVDWFSRRRTYTLEPLRHEGADALDPAGVDGLSQITLRELELTSVAAPHEVVTREAENLFETSAAPTDLMPPGWRVTRAGFDLHFVGQLRPRPVHIRPPNLLKLGRHCDLRLVDRWLWHRGFRVTA